MCLVFSLLVTQCHPTGILFQSVSGHLKLAEIDCTIYRSHLYCLGDFQPNANLMKCRWSSLWWLALRTSLHRAVRGPVWTESMNKQVHSWSCGMFHSPTTSRCDHKRLYRKLGFGLVLFQRQSLPPLPFSFSETFTFFCMYLTESSSHVLCILLNTMISSRPPHHM